ncbi:MAG TPA: SDR family oxidoreductase [Nocardioides sp.]|nr:SDR family oxidoreductase [Nocardioides sp.]
MVTGATGGLGSVVSRDLAADNWRLALVGTHRTPLDKLGADLGIAGDRWMAADANLRDRRAAVAAVESILGRFGRADALVHVVGGYHGGHPVVEVGDAEVEAMIGQHLWTTLNVVRAVVPAMTNAGWGRVVAVSSPMATTPGKAVAPYAIGKAAQEALLGTLAREVAGTGVTVNVLLVRQIDTKHERDANPTPKNAAWTTPEEISAAIRQLLSDEASAVNGAKIPLYGNG